MQTKTHTSSTSAARETWCVASCALGFGMTGSERLDLNRAYLLSIPARKQNPGGGS